MKHVSRRVTVLAIAAAVMGSAVAVATAASRESGRKAADVQVCVLLPDTKSSVRWVQFDAPTIAKALKAAGVTYSINNALNDPQKQKAQAQACLAAGAKVVIETSLDNGSAASIEKLFTSSGGKAIDYDRQVTGGSASVYVTFDGKAVGRAQAARHHRRDEEERQLRQEGHRRRALGRADRPERVLVQERERRHAEPALQAAAS